MQTVTGKVQARLLLGSLSFWSALAKRNAEVRPALASFAARIRLRRQAQQVSRWRVYATAAIQMRQLIRRAETHSNPRVGLHSMGLNMLPLQWGAQCNGQCKLTKERATLVLDSAKYQRRGLP